MDRLGRRTDRWIDRRIHKWVTAFLRGAWSNLLELLSNIFFWQKETKIWKCQWIHRYHVYIIKYKYVDIWKYSERRINQQRTVMRVHRKVALPITQGKGSGGWAYMYIVGRGHENWLQTKKKKEKKREREFVQRMTLIWIESIISQLLC